MKASSLAVRTHDLSFSFGQQPILRSVSLSVSRGEVFALLGSSGSGKSTLLHILTRQLRGFRGEASVLGIPLSQWQPSCYERIGVSFELPCHYSRLTALQNLRYFASLYTRPTMQPGEALQMVGLQDHGSKRLASFSKGMKMRLNLARALLHRPELLFLDEPTSGLDEENVHCVANLINACKCRGQTCLLTTHDEQFAKAVADRTGRLRKGNICEQPGSSSASSYN